MDSHCTICNLGRKVASRTRLEERKRGLRVVVGSPVAEVVPSQAGIDRETRRDLPVILHIDAAVHPAKYLVQVASQGTAGRLHGRATLIVDSILGKIHQVPETEARPE